MNEALAIHFGLGKTSWLYFIGRITRGSLKVAAGALSFAGGVALSETGIGAVIGVPVAIFGEFTAVEGATQILGYGEGEGGWNPGAEIASGVGEILYDQEGAQKFRAAYQLVDFGFSIAGGVAAIRNAAKIQKFQTIQSYKRVDGKLVKQFTSTGEGGTIIPQTITRKVPWELRVTGHTIEAILAGNAAYESARTIEVPAMSFGDQLQNE